MFTQLFRLLDRRLRGRRLARRTDRGRSARYLISILGVVAFGLDAILLASGLALLIQQGAWWAGVVGVVVLVGMLAG